MYSISIKSQKNKCPYTEISGKGPMQAVLTSQSSTLKDKILYLKTEIIIRNSHEGSYV